MADTTTTKITVVEFLHKNLVWILAFTAFMLWWTKNPNSAKGGLISSDTTHTQVLQPIVVNPAYTPQQNGNTLYVPIPQQYQPVTPATDISGLVAQVKELSDRNEYLAKEYFAQKNYQDSIQLKDSAGKRVGVVNLNQQVSENTLKKTQSSYQLLFPVTTITNKYTAPIRNQILFGGGIQSPVTLPKVAQIDLGLVFRNKTENQLAISGTYTFNAPLQQRIGVRVAYYQKISLRSQIPK